MSEGKCKMCGMKPKIKKAYLCLVFTPRQFINENIFIKNFQLLSFLFPGLVFITAVLASLQTFRCTCFLIIPHFGIQEKSCYEKP